MKKIAIFTFSVLLVAYLATVFGCGSSGGGGGTAYGGPSVFARFSYPTVFIYKNGSAQLATNLPNFNLIFTGEAVANATVIASNETTGQFTLCAYYGGGAYYSVAELKHGTGESVSLTAVTTTETMKGGPTTTPDSRILISSPAISAVVAVPFTITWTNYNGNSPAAYTALTIYNPSASSPEGYAEILPFAQTSFTVTSAMIRGKGAYVISLYPMNKMTFTGAASNSFGIVASCLSSLPNPLYVNIQ